MKADRKNESFEKTSKSKKNKEEKSRKKKKNTQNKKNILKKCNSAEKVKKPTEEIIKISDNSINYEEEREKKKKSRKKQISFEEKDSSDDEQKGQENSINANNRGNRNNDNQIINRPHKNKTYGFLLRYPNKSCDLNKLQALLDQMRNLFLNTDFKYLLVYYCKEIYAFIEINSGNDYNINFLKENLIYKNITPLVSYCKYPYKIFHCCFNNPICLTNMDINENYIRNAYKNKLLLSLDIKNWIISGLIELSQLEPTIRGFQLYRYYITKHKINIKRRKIWLVGPSLCGKTYVVTETFKNSLYQKSLDKSWDNYDKEKNVSVELNKEYSLDIANLLKDWTEDYNPTVTVNNLPASLNYKNIIIISKSSIENYFKDNHEMMRTFELRCEQITMRTQKDYIWIRAGLIDKRVFDYAKKYAQEKSSKSEKK